MPVPKSKIGSRNPTLRNAPRFESEKAAIPEAPVVSPRSDLVSSPEVAAYIGVQPGTLEVWRCTKNQRIPFLKVGRLVKYRLRDLDAWLASRAVDTEAT